MYTFGEKVELRDIISARRSYYDLGRNVNVNDDAIILAIEDAVKHVPSAYNSQSQRVAVMLGHDHKDLWDIIEAALRTKTGDERYALLSKEKINSFRSAYGTVLFFDDMTRTCEIGNRYPSNVGNFPIWAHQSSGMLQYTVWLLLRDMNLGASVQHYNPIADVKIRERWALPYDWKLLAQMPFGSIESEPSEKTFESLDTRMKVFRGKE